MNKRSSSEGGNFCVGCGLCCDGTLFEHAKVSPGEQLRMTAAGLEVFEQRGKPVFRLPCPHVHCGKCAIYGNRFEICHSFRCELLRRQEAAELSYSDAEATIQRAIDLRRAVVSIDAAAGSYRDRKRLRAELAAELVGAEGDKRKVIARRLVNMVALDEFLNCHFRGKKEESATIADD